MQRPAVSLCNPCSETWLSTKNSADWSCIRIRCWDEMMLLGVTPKGQHGLPYSFSVMCSMTVLFALTSKFPWAVNSRHTATPLTSIISFGGESLPHQRTAPLGLLNSYHCQSTQIFLHLMKSFLQAPPGKKKNLFCPRELRNKENETSIP